MRTDTKYLISDTLVELLKKKTVDKVTVKDVVEACHISRQTFYYHFQDLEDVMEWTVEKTMQKVLQESIKAESAQQAVQILVTTVMERTRNLMPKLMESQHRVKLEQQMLKMVRRYLQELIQRNLPALDIAYADLQATIDFYSYGITGLLLEYSIRSNMQPEYLARQIYRLMEDGLQKARQKNENQI